MNIGCFSMVFTSLAEQIAMHRRGVKSEIRKLYKTYFMTYRSIKDKKQFWDTWISWLSEVSYVERQIECKMNEMRRKAK